MKSQEVNFKKSQKLLASRAGSLKQTIACTAFNPNQTGGGGGGIHPPLDVSRDNFDEIFSRAPCFRDFSFESCANFDAIFVKIGRTVSKLRNVM